MCEILCPFSQFDFEHGIRKSFRDPSFHLDDILFSQAIPPSTALRLWQVSHILQATAHLGVEDPRALLDFAAQSLMHVLGRIQVLALLQLRPGELSKLVNDAHVFVVEHVHNHEVAPLSRPARAYDPARFYGFSDTTYTSLGDLSFRQRKNDWFAFGHCNGVLVMRRKARVLSDHSPPSPSIFTS